MRLATLALAFTTLTLIGCGSSPKIREEPTELKGTVKLPGGASPKDLTITFHPQENAPPGGGKVGADGSFTVKLVPGKYTVYFQDEANANVPAYQKVPESYRKVTAANTVTVESGKSLDIEVK